MESGFIDKKVDDCEHEILLYEGTYKNPIQDLELGTCFDCESTFSIKDNYILVKDVILKGKQIYLKKEII